MAEPSTVRLKARAELPGAEIVILDGKFQFVHRGLGSVDIALSPGVYTVQYHSGSAVTDVPVVLRPGSGEVTVPPPALEMKSPAPFEGNEAGTLYGAFARQCSKDVDQRPGSGGELFVFLRVAMRERSEPVDRSGLFDVAVLDARREQIANLRDSAKRGPDGLAVGFNLALDPGTYILRYRVGGGDLFEQSVVVSKDWQTQVFASSRRYGTERYVLGPNLPEAAVFMVPCGRGFDPTSTGEQRWTESARQALAQGSTGAPWQHLADAVQEVRQLSLGVPPDQLDLMLRSKFTKPMLGVYGAHLLLRTPDPDWPLLREVVTNLRRIIGEHPDVTALTLLPELKDLSGNMSYPLPPMLRTSWKLIVANGPESRERVPAGSVSEAVAERTWGSGAWLVWRSLPPEERGASHAPRATPGEPAQEPFTETVASRAGMSFEQAVAAIQDYVARHPDRMSFSRFLGDVTGRLRLTDAERAILAYIAMTVSRSTHLLDAIRGESGLVGRVLAALHGALARTQLVSRARDILETEAGLQAALSGARLVRALGLPAGALERATVALAQKLTAGK